jgi:fatty acid-binding protein DegV
MYRDIIDGDKLKELLPDLPEDLSKGKLEIFVQAYSDDMKKMEEVLQKIKKQINRSAFLGKEKEVFFFENDDIPEDLRKPLSSKLKELGYSTDIKEGARGTVILTIHWKNA